MNIAVLGAAPSSRLLAPFHDWNWEIWACSPPNYDLPRVDAWFELHNLDRKFTQANEPWLKKIVQHDRVYLARPDPRLPKGIVYPKDEMLAKYGEDFFTSSIAWMMALAIEQKPDTIGLWGVDMSAHDEIYGSQRAGCKFFIREAKKAGIKVIAAAQSDILMHTPLYGYKEFSRMWWKQQARRKELEQRLQQAQALSKKHSDEATLFKGALDDMNYMENTYCPTNYEGK